jgi:flavin reductase (DIM6/NTAB) family NADH-FMN oxidoreductase RutF
MINIAPTGSDRNSFRSMMSRFPTGVTVVTCVDAGVPRGMTCSAVCSVALDPPTILIGVRAASPTVAAVLASGRFAVNMLHRDAQGVAELFASGAADRFDRVPWHPGAGGPHLPMHGHTVADCTVSASHQVGDHLVLFGEIIDITRYDDRAPLLYGLRAYRSW